MNSTVERFWQAEWLHRYLTHVLWISMEIIIQRSPKRFKKNVNRVFITCLLNNFVDELINTSQFYISSLERHWEMFKLLS